MGVGTRSSVARRRVSGAIPMRCLASTSPILRGLKRRDWGMVEENEYCWRWRLCYLNCGISRYLYSSFYGRRTSVIGWMRCFFKNCSNQLRQIDTSQNGTEIFPKKEHRCFPKRNRDTSQYGSGKFAYHFRAWLCVSSQSTLRKMRKDPSVAALRSTSLVQSAADYKYEGRDVTGSRL